MNQAPAEFINRYFKHMAKPKLEPGTKAPEFNLPDQDGTAVTLEKFHGSWLVLYFYPRDNTSGCTAEAVDFTASITAFRKLNAKIVGVSPDTVESHRKFIQKQDLVLQLLSDGDKKVLKLYGVWQIKKLYGKESYGVVRSTFLIDTDGIIRRRWDRVKVAGHVEDVLNTLKELSGR